MEQITTTFLIFIFGAVLVEKLVEIVSRKLTVIDNVTISMIIGILVALYARFNIMGTVGIEFGWAGLPQWVNLSAEFMAILFSGLVLSSGSNAVHDFFSKLTAMKETQKAILENIKTANSENSEK